MMIEIFNDCEPQNIYTNKNILKYFYSEQERINSNPYLKNDNVFDRKCKVFTDNIYFLKKIYGDLNVDIISNYVEMLSTIYFRKSIFQCVYSFKWLSENVSMSSFLNMIFIKLNRSISEQFNKFDAYKHVSGELHDILNMINQIYVHKEVFTYEKRLKFDELHNAVTRQHLKATIQNHQYPLHFLKEPYHENDFTVIEPSHSIQLAEWASTVKNCVYSYENKILDGSSAIFLVYKNNKPKFTVEVTNFSQGNPKIKCTEKIYKSAMGMDERVEVESVISKIIHHS